MKYLFIISGPSGAGKTATGNILEDKYNIHECISTTTRKKRHNEVEGKDYYFVDKEYFLNQDNFIEVNYYAGNYYGLSLNSVIDAFKKNQKAAFVIAEREGAKQIKDYYKNDKNIKVICIFLMITLENMKKRMLFRGDQLIDVEKRIKHAKSTNELFVPNIADYIVDANKSLDKVIDSVYNIIYEEINNK